jgi:putative nucleotidyltransferase with HDIG domain
MNALPGPVWTRDTGAAPGQSKQMRWVPLGRLELGMFVHPLDRPSFRLERQSDLRAIIDSGVRGMWIDEARSSVLTPRPAATRPRPSGTTSPAEAKASGTADRRRLSDVAITDTGARAARFGRASETLRALYKPVESLLTQARLGQTMSDESVRSIVAQVSESVQEDASALISLARMRQKDSFTYMHSIAVCALMINLARRLDLDRGSLQDMGVAGLLHDVGKMLVPPAVLNKPGALTDEETAIMRLHVVRGHELLKGMRNVPQVALDVCLNHHEKFDGSGYPHGLAGEQISLAARMGAVCDVYDAITSNRPYKEAWTPAECLASMFSWKGHFDEKILAHFIRSVGIYPVGSLIRLRSDHLALVLEQHEDDLTKPLVRIFYSIATRSTVPHRDVVLAQDGSDAVVSREEPSRWGFFQWDQQWPRMIAG